MKRWIALVAMAAAAVSGTVEAGAPFRVADSIAMTRLVDPAVNLPQYFSPSFNLSPNQQRLVIVTRRGNLETGRNEYRLGAYQTDAVLHFVNSPQIDTPSIDWLATFESASTWPAIDAVKWQPDGRTLAFIGRGVDQIGQVFTFDLVSRRLSQLTRSEYDIMKYDLSGDGRVLVYSALVPPDWRERNLRGYAVSSEFVANLAWTDPADALHEVRHFVADLAKSEVRAAGMSPHQYPEMISVSPQGDVAVIVAYLQTTPPGWYSYEFVQERMRRASQAGALEPEGEGTDPSAVFDNEMFGPRLGWLTQAALIETATGRVRPLIDAPLTASATFFQARWSPQGRRLAIAPTYLPLSNAGEDRGRRQRSAAIAEVDVATGRVQRVADVPAGVRLTRLEWVAEGMLRASYARHGGGVLPARMFIERHGERHGKWSEIDAAQLPSRSPLQLSIAQGLNEPYEIIATDVRNGRRRALTDLNPQLRAIELPRVEHFRWSDRLGRTFLGGLIHPPDFDPARRYPLVIQGGGFDAASFSTDGGPGLQAAYPGRALASHGLLVLQMPWGELADSAARPTGTRGACESWQDCGEGPRWVAMIEGAIDALDSAGLIDRARVGLIGFSRDGMFVHHAVTFSRYPIAAATISDSISASPMTYAFVYGFAYPGMLEFEAEASMGAPFWGSGIQRWMERSPVFHLDRIRAPLRIEYIGKGISAYWDTFANLKRHRRPVELVHIPLDVHVLETPLGRYTSLQGNVDWFRFWLLHEEDPDPRKAAQYVRWRKLRRQYERAQRAADRSGAAFQRMSSQQTATSDD